MKQAGKLTSIGGLLLVVLLVAGIDQLSKLAITSSFAHGEVRPIVPGFFNLVLVYNRGAAFGLFSNLSEGMRQLVLGLTTTVALVFIAYFLLKEYFADRWARLALGGIIGGAIGNIIDRVRLGQVVDFVDVYVGTYHWPAFNVADSAICVGVVILILRSGKKKGLEVSASGDVGTVAK